MWGSFKIDTTISIIIPVLNEEKIIQTALKRLQNFRQQGAELILVDGGSSDDTLLLAQNFVDKTLVSKPGRALQMNTGAKKASGDLLLFLHIDTILSDECYKLLLNLNHQASVWGRFDVRLSNPKFIYKLIAFGMNQRSRITHVATGDQCIFVTKALFNHVDGYPEIALMEDVALSVLLRNIKKPICFKQTVLTSSRRWEHNGVSKTIITMWVLRLAYFFNISPKRLHAIYEK